MRTYRSTLVTGLVGIWLAAGLAFPATTTADMQETKLTASDGGAADNFGLAVAISGDTAVVGANKARAGAFPQGGAA